MSLGQFARVLLGDRRARVVGRAYRALFVDLERVAMAIAPAIPDRAHVLDVGGGDGEHLNRLLCLRDDINVTTIDVAAKVGGWIDPRYSSRVTRLPSTSIQDYAVSGRAHPEVILVSDVVHHVPLREREAFLATAIGLMDCVPGSRIIIKDVEPHYFRSALGYLSDRLVSGDRSVSLVSRRDLIATLRRICDRIRWNETELFSVDPPNYALVVSR